VGLYQGPVDRSLLNDVPRGKVKLTSSTGSKRRSHPRDAVPRVSIGLPVYNGERYLTESLDSLLSQTFEDFELIVSDNASTDGTAEICHRYAKEDSRIRYFRQPYNVGSSPNHNFVILNARGALFKSASHDDRYAPELLERCVEVLDQCPQFVLAHSWSSVTDATGAVRSLVDYPVATDAPRAPDRFRSMLFDGWGDDEGGVVRTSVLRQTGLHGSYHFADRVLTAELALYGPFYMVPERLYFRREHSGQGGGIRDVRGRCASLDPRRADKIRHPLVRLYGEYLLGYVTAIRHAPLSTGDRQACYRTLARWAMGRFAPVTQRTLLRKELERPEVTARQVVAT
jgi:glycosyltransferase involved in cell wall biosynthesis